MLNYKRCRNCGSSTQQPKGWLVPARESQQILSIKFNPKGKRYTVTARLETRKVRL